MVPVAVRLTHSLGVVALMMTVSAAISGCGSGTPPGDLDRGASAIRAYGCGACHEIAGIRGANGRIGPSLTGFGSRAYIAGYLPNQRETLVRWIMQPQAFRQPTAMPNLNVTERDARAIAAYLHSLR